VLNAIGFLDFFHLLLLRTSFGNCICFRPQVKRRENWAALAQLYPLEITNHQSWPHMNDVCLAFHLMTETDPFSEMLSSVGAY
jgi:hypothetical protein